MGTTLSFYRKRVSYSVFTLVLAVYFATVVNISIYKELWRILARIDVVKTGFVISLPLFFLAVFNLLFQFISWPRIGKPLFIILLFLSGILSYSTYNYGALFGIGVIASIVETDTTEIGSYLSWYFILWMVLISVLPAILVYKAQLIAERNLLRLLSKKLLSIIASLSLIFVIAVFYYKDYASVGRNNQYLRKMIIPEFFITSTVKYIRENYLSTPKPYLQIGLDAKQSPRALTQAKTKPTLLVLAIGETARSQNYQLNGYHRETNQYTKNLKVISFQNVASCGTLTAVSVPCMFSLMTRDNFNRIQADNQDNLLDILKHAGISVLWKENDGGDKSVAKNIKKITIDRTRQDKMCPDKSCYDEALLEDFEKNINSLTGNRVLVLHLMGSHGPTYFRRYPKNMKKFLPECSRSDIENCTVDEIVNTYDNTILYTDYVLYQIINKLKSLEKDFNSSLIYISDHGESLGEYGLFLHGTPYSLAPDVQRHVPLIVWMSPEFKLDKNINSKCLALSAKNNKTYSQDNFFHSILGIMDVKTSVYQEKLDFFSECRTVG